MKRFLVICAWGAFAAIATPAASAQALSTGHPSADTSLYDAFGGKAGLARLMADFVPRLRADVRIGDFFKDTNPKELQTQLTDQLCVVCGGPCVYDGATMKKAHADMKVGKADFNALVEVLQDSMDAQGITFSVQNRLLARLAPMHRDIVDAR